MAKRFIDTELFNDEWFMNLSKDGKLFFVYFITQCNHAGILKLNKKLFEFQSGIKSTDTVIKELGNCIVKVKEGVYFMPKYIKFQYPDFPKSNVKQQASAIKLLQEYELFDENLNSCVTVTKELDNSCDNDNDNVNDSINNITKKTNSKFTPPTLDEVKEYARQRGFEMIAKKFFDYYNTGNWKDAKGNQVKNWKQKFITWENKTDLPQQTAKYQRA